MLDAEAALARACARKHLITAQAGEAIAAACRAERFDAGGLAAAGAAASAAAALADRHRATPMAGRTLLQQALPTSFGLRAAGWMVAIDEAGTALEQVRDRGAAVQMGDRSETAPALGRLAGGGVLDDHRLNL